MTDTITLYPQDASKVKIDAELHIYQGLYDHFGYKMPNARFIPSVKAKIWDGVVRLFSIQTRTLPIGLIPRLEKYAKALEIDVDFSKYIDPSVNSNITLEEVKAFAESLNIHSGGKKIEPREYQINTVYEAIKRGRMIAIAPTSAGKSLILYIFINWFREKVKNKILLIVPSTQLVLQMLGDFKDYHNGDVNIDNPEEYCHIIMSGKEKYDDTKKVFISTWQSLQNITKGKDKLYTLTYFNEFEVVICDETHLAKSTQISNILNSCVNAYIRLGVTGTLDGTDTTQLQLEGLFGPVHHVITTKELMDSGAVSTLDIKCVTLTYPDEIRKNATKLSYQEELDFLVTYPSRLKFVTNLAVSMKNNTLILVNYVEKHGKPLYDSIKAKVGDTRQVFFIHGSVDAEIRDEMRKIVETTDDAIIIGSFGVLSTGTNIKRLFNIIFASPSKSQVRVLQSLGRGLRLGSDKNHCVLYDISDDLSWKKHKNYTLKHFIERVKMYSSQKFNYKLNRINLP